MSSNGAKENSCVEKPEARTKKQERQGRAGVGVMVEH